MWKVIGGALYSAVKWIAIHAAKAIAWAAAHPAVGILVGLAAWSMGRWARGQTFFGAQALAGLLEGAGYSLVTAGFLGWLAKPSVGIIGGWYSALLSIFPGQARALPDWMSPFDFVRQ